jgi:hypothetical protein
MVFSGFPLPKAPIHKFCALPAMFAGYDRALPVLVMIDVRGK